VRDASGVYTARENREIGVKNAKIERKKFETARVKPGAPG
jgi:hypothetical protein